MEETNLKYEKHIFICTNQRADDAPRVSCGEVAGMALVNAFKEMLKEKKLNIKLRAQKTGCFDICEMGPNVAVYPEGIFYGKVTLNDVEEIVNEHLINNRPVQRLQLKFKQVGK